MIRGIKIRPLEIDDLPFLFTMGEQILDNNNIFTKPWSFEEISNILSESMDLSFLLYRKKQIFGFLIGSISFLNKNQPNAEIVWMGIIPEIDKSSMEKYLVKTFKEAVLNRGISRITVDIKNDKTNIVNLFKKYGFNETESMITLELKV